MGLGLGFGLGLVLGLPEFLRQQVGGLALLRKKRATVLATF